MEHLIIFASGTGFGLLVAFFTGFFKKAGEHFFIFLNNKIYPPEPEPIEVEKTFQPDSEHIERCSWVGEEKLTFFLNSGYAYYKCDRTGAKFFRFSSIARNHKEFLMCTP
jgi:hypothetical protein